MNDRMKGSELGQQSGLTVWKTFVSPLVCKLGLKWSAPIGCGPDSISSFAADVRAAIKLSNAFILVCWASL